MHPEGLSPEKEREIDVGLEFIRAFNSLNGTNFEGDASYFADSADPVPDLRFVSASEKLMYGEVVALGEGEGALRDAALRGQLIAAVQRELDRRLPRDVLVQLVPAGELPAKRQVEWVAAIVGTFAVDKVEDLQKGKIAIDRRGDLEGELGILMKWFDRIVVSSRPERRSGCAVYSRTIEITARAWLEETIRLKQDKRYERPIHLLLDNRAVLLDAGDIERCLEDGPLAIDEFDGVWFVDLEKGHVVRLDGARASP